MLLLQLKNKKNCFSPLLTHFPWILKTKVQTERKYTWAIYLSIDPYSYVQKTSGWININLHLLSRGWHDKTLQHSIFYFLLCLYIWPWPHPDVLRVYTWLRALGSILTVLEGCRWGLELNNGWLLDRQALYLLYYLPGLCFVFFL